MFELTRENAWNVLTEHTKSESLRKHALAVEAAVRGYARKFGEDEEVWGVVALLHDFDYELKANGITVTTLCPGPTESEFKVRAKSQRSRLFEAFVMDAPSVARVGYDAMMKGKAVAIPGLRNKMIPIATRLAPRPWIAELSHRAARPVEK